MCSLKNEDQKSEEKKQKRIAPYVSFTTFINTITGLASTHPNRIDRSVFQGQSGGVVNQLLTSYRFLDLCDDHGQPSDALKGLWKADENERKKLIKAIIQEHYPTLVQLNLAKASPAQIGEEIEKTGATGATRVKSVGFFLKAAKYAGMELSPLLGRQTRDANGQSSVVRRRRRSKPTIPRTQGLEHEQAHEQTEGSESKEIKLPTGGTLRLTATAKFLSLGTKDRAFVFQLVDLMNNHEKSESENK